jgi:preprotein translocase subunit SecG
MGVAGIIVNIVLIVVSAVLIAIVLMQQTKSAGLGGAFGGDTSSFTARGRKASREAKLQKLTVILAIAIGVLAIAMMFIS